MLNKFIFKKEWHELIKRENDQERLEAYDTIFSMAFDTGLVHVPSIGIINFLHGAVFKEVARQQGIVQKRRIAGAKGGTQKATNAASPSTLPSIQGGAGGGSASPSTLPSIQGGAGGGSASPVESLPSIQGGAGGGSASPPTLPSIQGGVGGGSASPVESDSLFGVFWDRYALKRDKESAQRAWKRLKETEQVAAINGIEAYKARCAIEGVHRMYPQGYITHRRWEDEPVLNGSPVNHHEPVLNGSAVESKKLKSNETNDKNKRRGMEVTAQKPSDFQSTF